MKPLSVVQVASKLKGSYVYVEFWKDGGGLQIVDKSDSDFLWFKLPPSGATKPGEIVCYWNDYNLKSMYGWRAWERKPHWWERVHARWHKAESGVEYMREKENE